MNIRQKSKNFRISDILKYASVVVGLITGSIVIFNFGVPYFNCPGFDLAGDWRIETEVDKVVQEVHSNEMGISHVFLATLSQGCEEVSGTATKIESAGIPVSGSSRSYLELTTLGVSGNELQLRFVETWQGRDAKSNGTITVNIDSEGRLMRGRFRTAIGGISGTVVARREN